jgi:hypothetical protein
VRSRKTAELVRVYSVDIADRYGSVSKSWCQSFAQHRHGSWYTCHIVMNSFEYCWMVYSDTLQFRHWLNHVNVLYRLDRSADNNTAGRNALTRGWRMGRCGSGGQHACSHWTCITDRERAGTSATEIDFSDTTSSCQQLDKSLLVSLVDLGVQSPDRGNDIGTNAGFGYYIQRSSVSMDLNGWTNSGMGQGIGSRWRRRVVGPGNMFTSGVELQLSSL